MIDEILALGNSANVRCVVATSSSSKWTLEEDDLPGVDDETSVPTAADPLLRDQVDQFADDASREVSEDDAEEMEATPRSVFSQSNKRRNSSDCSTSSTKASEAPAGEFRICHVHEGMKVLPLGDYLGMIGKMLEAILVNSAISETGAAMVEGEVPQRLVQLLVLGKPHPALLQSTYLQSLASILRSLVVSNSTKVVEEDSRPPSNPVLPSQSTRHFTVGRSSGLRK